MLSMGWGLVLLTDGGYIAEGVLLCVFSLVFPVIDVIWGKK